MTETWSWDPYLFHFFFSLLCYLAAMIWGACSTTHFAMMVLPWSQPAMDSVPWNYKPNSTFLSFSCGCWLLCPAIGKLSGTLPLCILSSSCIISHFPFRIRTIPLSDFYWLAFPYRATWSGREWPHRRRMLRGWVKFMNITSAYCFMLRKFLL